MLQNIKTKSSTLFVFLLVAQICLVKCFTPTISAEILRICRAKAAEDDFYRSAPPFLSRMHKQGALEDETGKCINKLLDRHEQEFKKFGINKAKVKNFVLENLH